MFWHIFIQFPEKRVDDKMLAAGAKNGLCMSCNVNVIGITAVRNPSPAYGTTRIDRVKQLDPAIFFGEVFDY